MTDEPLPQATAPGNPRHTSVVGADGITPDDLVPPPNHLLAAILATVFCFMPVGVVAIVKAAQVNDLWRQGRIEESVRASEAARTWAIAAVVAWVLVIVAGMAFGLAVSITVSGDATGVEVGP